MIGLLLASPLAADRLELVNGDVISGTIREMDGQRIVIETDYGVLEIDRSAVRLGQFGNADAPSGDGLVFRFSFSGTVEDSVGSHQAVNNGMRFVADREGAPASALRSDGSSTYLSLLSTPELNRLDQLTIAFWVRLEDPGSTQYLFSKWTATDGEKADGKLSLQTAGGHLTLYLVDPDGVYHWLSARSVLTAFDWQAVAVSFAAGRATMYVDGAPVATRRFEFTRLFEDAAPLLFMTAEARTDDAFAYYNAVGAIDELRLYSRALSPDEIASLAEGKDTR